MTLQPVTRSYVAVAGSASALTETRGATLFAGGTDIIPLARAGVVESSSLVDIKASTLPASIAVDDDEWTIGALVTLSELERHDEFTSEFAVVKDALGQIATLQIRNRATVGGNLLQRPRCSYFRDADVDCWMKGGTDCPARDGRNEHSALSGEHCVATQPSDLAAVWCALDADVSIRCVDGSARRVPVAEFLAPPTPERRSLHTLAEGEVIESIHLRRAGSGLRSVYVKAMDRAVWQFALVGVAATVRFDDDGSVVSARLVGSGVANTPLDLSEAIGSLVGGRLTADGVGRVAERASDGLGSLSENRYKVSLLRGLVVRALKSFAS